ncbi:redoxin domain-containing protein [Tunicatimonas pelagia]|uniref:redoxin domain-containing protein n=1 Tax=Tunicatimonas pelagia TaxID=931531 RepID=UPI002665F4E8|nr:redoxin domain-containing protein [Tunicatimonas pelagia]WKN45983.1 redoxin domain-containing protein [Tunicatimonas pelagia]
MLKVICNTVVGLFIGTLSTSSSFQSDQIQDFTLPNVVSGTDFSLSQYKNAGAVVIIFTSLYCPYAKFYEDRISRLTDVYRNNSNIRIVLISPNNPAKSRADAVENVTNTAKRRQLGVPVLIDQSQQVADLLGAAKTPEAFVLTPHQGSFRIAYQGAIDDNPQVEKDVRHHYLQSVIDAVSQRQPIVTSNTPTTGCMIKR